jgi:hypothetical protein
MSDVTNEVTARIRISGSAHDLLDVVPSLRSSGGELYFRKENLPPEVMSEAFWVVEAVLMDQETTEPAISQLLDLADAGGADFAAVCADGRFDVEVECTVDLYSERVIYEVSKNSLRRVCALNASLSFDVYDNLP